MIKIILAFGIFFAFDLGLFLGFKAGIKIKRKDRYCNVIDIKNHLGKSKKFIRDMNKF